jgi:branched-chain amino acid transport system substrate-binding protein
MENNVLLDSQALTKIQSIIILAIILVAALGSSIYFLVNQPEQSSDTIKIGILADLDNVRGMQIWKGAKLAVEQINAEGGMLGKQIELIGEDHNLESGADMVEVNTALTRLISIHNVDFIIGQTSNEIGFGVQDIISE